jgi:outer membrane protein assembly factor BamA
MARRALGFFVVFGVLGGALLSGGAQPGSACGAPEAAPAKPGRWLVLPILGYTPETKIIAGLGGVYYFRPAGSRADVRPSQIWIAVIATQKRQYMLWLLPDLYLKNEAVRINTAFKLENYPQKYFGVGNDTPDEAEEDYTYRRAYLEVTALRRIRSHLSAGLCYEGEYGKIVKPDPGGSLDRGLVPGSGTTTVSGLGLAVSWDSRDNVFSPSRGSYHQAWLSGYHGLLGSEYNFLRLKLDLRRYVSVAARHVLALQAMIRLTSGTPPFQFMGMIGGDTLMRGYYMGRYRDKNLAVLQAEYRMPVWWRFGLAVFASAGDVAPSPGKFRLASFKAAGGLGLRFLFDPKEKTSLRLDFGFGKNTSGMYITATEAF